ncbi:MAG: enoyl-CoA hydratase/isomerase family protein [Acidimicrobiia bacterium]|nr:enoyl-CoA hydratase/isomerase family protein [Acidimicrobiia bacterium]
MAYDTLTVKISDNVAWLTLNRPDKLNALNPKMMEELRHAFNDLDEREDVRAVLIRGEGRAFCAGMDLKWSEELSDAERLEQGRLGGKTFDMMERMEVPVIAAVHGHAVGGGLEIALAADLIVASEESNMGLVEITLSADPPFRPKMTEDGDPDQPTFGGSAPGWGGVRRLPERIGKARAKQMLFTGMTVDGRKGYEMGLVADVYPADEFEAQVTELATRIGAMNRSNLRLVKELVNTGADWVEPHVG